MWVFMSNNIFFESLSKLPLEQRFIISEMSKTQPELFAHFKKLFYQKFDAIKNSNKNEVENIYNQEKEEILKILSEIIKEN